VTLTTFAISLCRRLHRPPHDLTQTIMPMTSAMIRSCPCRSFVVLMWPCT